MFDVRSAPYFRLASCTFVCILMHWVKLGASLSLSHYTWATSTRIKTSVCSTQIQSARAFKKEINAIFANRAVCKIAFLLYTLSVRKNVLYYAFVILVSLIRLV
jgi:hypothetical protein